MLGIRPTKPIVNIVKALISNPVFGGQCNLIHHTILRRFSWPSLAYMCVQRWPTTPLILFLLKVIESRYISLSFLKHVPHCIVSQSARYIDPMLVQCWAIVCDAGPTLYHHWVNVSYLLVLSGVSTEGEAWRVTFSIWYIM